MRMGQNRRQASKKGTKILGSLYIHRIDTRNVSSLGFHLTHPRRCLTCSSAIGAASRGLWPTPKLRVSPFQVAWAWFGLDRSGLQCPNTDTIKVL
ncbi:hypothetical protein CH063_12887 [Colletotrichum higginsianum]|uniref:Uncharacterized protein n=1 Tax=Colletotrichum higginsianum (strain IMI 349063) TaxID=759273 RepID=H1VS68_COLHI|nr:hypothetical protein CH63R_12347 [Colletotrichum higginsianum IMI 349063]OBR03220.1 hypothetical protein CH63R_12347 [Colletotrichum higginsianum IMI 349063]CCF43075.1 hypothetical protein CH063_12887 [Colletotrichum higginsianum]